MGCYTGWQDFHWEKDTEVHPEGEDHEVLWATDPQGNRVKIAYLSYDLSFGEDDYCFGWCVGLFFLDDDAQEVLNPPLDDTGYDWDEAKEDARAFVTANGGWWRLSEILQPLRGV